MIGALRPQRGGDYVQPKFTLRKFFAVCLIMVMGGVNGAWAGDWNSDYSQVTYNFDRYSTNFTFSQGGSINKTLSVGNNSELYLMTDNGANALGNQFAAQDVTSWEVLGSGTSHSESPWQLHSKAGGARCLSILKLFAGATVTINYTAPSKTTEGVTTYDYTTFVDGSQVSGGTTGGTLTSGTSYTIAKDGTLDLLVPRYTFIQSVVINYGSTKHLTFTDASGNSMAGYQNSLPYYRYRLSSRAFAEPTPSVFPAYSGGTLTYHYKIQNYGTSVGQKEVAVDPNYSTNGDILFKNLGWCQVTVIAKDGDTEVAQGSYLIEVWDNEAYYVVDKNSNGVPYKYRFAKDPAITVDDQQGGVLKSRTVTAVEGMEMKFGIPEAGGEPNTTVVYKYTIGGTDHMVSFTNNDEGWWDRLPNNNYQTPVQGTFYSFKATASGKLKFGGVKPFQNSDDQASDYRATAGKVYLVKIDPGADYPQTPVFSAGQSGYLESGEITMEAGVIYFLQGENNGTTQTPFLLEWFSYETDLKVSKTFGVASKPGSEIGSSETITTDAQVTLNGTAVSSGVTLEYDRKGNISSASLALNGSGYITISNITFSSESQKGGAIKVKVKNGSDEKDYVFTIPYGKHVWDFRTSGKQGSRVTDAAYTDAALCTMMKENTTEWNRVYKMHSKSGGTWVKLADPIMAASSIVEGDNAFYMDNTAGLIFVTTDPESFGAQQTGFPSGYDDLDDDTKYLMGYETISATNMVWIKGNTTTNKEATSIIREANTTIYFPGVKANQYIKVYTYRHADDKGERFFARNLVDLDGKSYSTTDAINFFRLRGITHQDGGGSERDNITGAAIFKVPSDYTDTDVLANIPSLSLCDDGWAKIYRIEIMDEYMPDMKLINDLGTSEAEDAVVNIGGAVAPDSKFGSIVLRKSGSTVTPETQYYVGRADFVDCQNANTPRYAVTADAGVSVTPSIINWKSGGGVSYNRLKLVFNSGNGNVRIIQREVVNKTGSGVSSTIGNVSSTDYVIDKNEYYIAVGELAVQDYPYTWDFSMYNLGANHNGTNGASSTVEAIEGTSSNSSNYGYWSNRTAPSYAVANSASVAMGTNTSNDPNQNLNVNKPLFAEGADLKAGTTTIIEGEGLGFSLPTQQKSVVVGGTTYYYDGYNTTSSFGMNGSGVTGVGTITIPEVDAGMYIFVKASAEPNSVEGAAAVSSDPFSVKSGVYLYQTLSSGDVLLGFSAATQVDQVAVTNLVKTLNELGYATESRDHAIDHTYQEKLTNHPVKAYAVTTYNGGAYNYKGYPEVKLSDNNVTVVPATKGVVLHEANYSANSTFPSPLFYPAVNIAPTNADVTTLATNCMAPNVTAKRHYMETICWYHAMAGANGTHVPETDHPNTSCDNWDKFVMTRTYYIYEKTGSSGTISGPNHTSVEAFYRFKLMGNDTDDTLGDNKAYLLIHNLPLALWNNGNGQGVAGQAREGVIYLNLEDYEENDATNIDNSIIDHSTKNDVYYSISGARISGKPTTKGFYIHNGKKVSVK